MAEFLGLPRVVCAFLGLLVSLVCRFLILVLTIEEWSCLLGLSVGASGAVGFVGHPESVAKLNIRLRAVLQQGRFIIFFSVFNSKRL